MFAKYINTGILITLGSAMIFGLYPPAARIVYQEGGNITLVIIATTFCRMFGLVALTKYRGYKIFDDTKRMRLSSLAGITQIFAIIGILGGTYFMPGAIVIAIMFSWSLMLLLFTAWRKEITLNPVNLVATLTAIVGLSLVLDAYGHGENVNVAGVTLAFFAGIVTFAGVYIFGFISKIKSPLIVGSEMLIIAFACSLLLLFWQTPVLPRSDWGLLMLALCCMSLAIGSLGMFFGIKILGSYKYSMMIKVEPIFTAIFGILIAKNYLINGQYIGILLVVSSLITIHFFDRQVQK